MALAPREKDVLRLVLKGEDLNGSAAKLEVSKQCIRTNRRSATTKMRTCDAYAAAIKARQLGEI